MTRALLAALLLAALALGSGVAARAQGGEPLCSPCGGSRTVACPTCGGAGRGELACYGCDGRGQLACLACEDGWVPCSNLACAGGEVLRSAGGEDFEDDCRTCKDGRLACTQCKKGTAACVVCKGRRTTSVRPCRDCAAKGVLPCPECAVNPAVPCPWSGAEAHRPCAACELPRERMRCWSCGGKAEVACVACAGSGESPCFDCAGTGKLYEQSGSGSRVEPRRHEACRGRGAVDCTACERGVRACERCAEGWVTTCFLCGDTRLAPCPECDFGHRPFEVYAEVYRAEGDLARAIDALERGIARCDERVEEMLRPHRAAFEGSEVPMPMTERGYRRISLPLLNLRRSVRERLSGRIAELRAEIEATSGSAR